MLLKNGLKRTRLEALEQAVLAAARNREFLCRFSFLVALIIISTDTAANLLESASPLQDPLPSSTDVPCILVFSLVQIVQNFTSMFVWRMSAQYRLFFIAVNLLAQMPISIYKIYRESSVREISQRVSA